jgi:serine phosphatase RsbU (regulator of sigma subunit)
MKPEVQAERQVLDLREPDGLAAETPAGWTEPLDQLVKALLRAVSQADVAAAVVAYGTAAVGARCARVVLLDQHGAVAVSLLGGQAVPSQRLEGNGFDMPCPWVTAVREGATLVFDSAQELYRAYPGMAPDFSLSSDGAVVAVPLSSAGHICGAVTFGFDGEGEIAADVRMAIAHVASLAAYAARRAVLYDAQYHAAEVLQAAYLPGRLPEIAGFTVACRSLSAGEPVGVAGDWYDGFALPDGRVGLMMGDVAGHGIQASTVMASLRAALRAFATVEASPAPILGRMNDYLNLFKPYAFATIFVGVFDPTDGRLRYASAGHPPALLLGPDGSAEMLSGPLGPPLGLPGIRYEQGERCFPAGSTLVVYTDGLVERRDGDIDVGMADLVRSASGHREDGPEGLSDRLVFELLAGVDLFDDATLMVARRDGVDRSSPPSP